MTALRSRKSVMVFSTSSSPVAGSYTDTNSNDNLPGQPRLHWKGKFEGRWSLLRRRVNSRVRKVLTRLHLTLSENFLTYEFVGLLQDSLFSKVRSMM